MSALKNAEHEAAAQGISQAHLAMVGEELRKGRPGDREAGLAVWLRAFELTADELRRRMEGAGQ